LRKNCSLNVCETQAQSVSSSSRSLPQSYSNRSIQCSKSTRCFHKFTYSYGVCCDFKTLLQATLSLHRIKQTRVLHTSFTASRSQLRLAWDKIWQPPKQLHFMQLSPQVAQYDLGHPPTLLGVMLPLGTVCATALLQLPTASPQTGMFQVEKVKRTVNTHSHPACDCAAEPFPHRHQLTLGRKHDGTQLTPTLPPNEVHKDTG
jgi:hypothetical protein